MNIIYVKKQQPTGYSFQTTCYDQFQIIVVCEGTLHYSFPDSSGKVTPRQMLVLPTGSTFKLFCRNTPYSGVGILVESENPRFRASAKEFALDSRLRALTQYLMAEIDDPRPDDEQSGLLIATILLEHTLDLLWKHESPPINEARYWADKTRQAIERSIHTHQSVAVCVKKLGLSYRQLSRHFTTIYQESPKHFQLRLKLEKSKEMLQTSNASLSDITYEMGFSSLQHFSTAFQREFGVPPGRYVKQKK